VDKGLEGLVVELGDGAFGQLLPCGCELGKQLCLRSLSSTIVTRP